MARPLRIQYPGAYYHITCRGNERKEIFLDGRDEEIFLNKLARSLDIYKVSCLAYICMPNHFHLLATTPEGNLSEFMRHFNISYTSAFNKRHDRVGHLYQGRYKSFLIDADNYLLSVSRYVHLNPIRVNNLLNKKADQKWKILMNTRGSSLPGYLSVRKRVDFLDYQILLDYMGGDNQRGRRYYRRFIQQGLTKEIDNPLQVGKGNGIVGESDFVEDVKEKFIEKDKAQREIPALRALSRELEPEELIRHFASLSGKSKAEICQRGKKTVERAMLMELLYRFCHLTQPQIGELVGGIDYSAVSKARKRLQLQCERDLKLKKRFVGLTDRLTELSRIKI
jgi:REP element-mobilizing transposase RayT